MTCSFCNPIWILTYALPQESCLTETKHKFKNFGVKFWPAMFVGRKAGLDLRNIINIIKNNLDMRIIWIQVKFYLDVLAQCVTSDGQNF